MSNSFSGMHQYRISEIVNALADRCAGGADYQDTVIPALEGCCATKEELEFLGLGWLADLMFAKEATDNVR